MVAKFSLLQIADIFVESFVLFFSFTLNLDFTHFCEVKAIAVLS